MKNVLLILSIVINIVLVIFCFAKGEKKQSEGSSISVKTIDYEISSMNNFETVYLNRNDSIYKTLWNEAFENQPQSAFLIACSYFYVTKDERILKDIELSTQQLENVYQRKFSIEEVKK